MPSDIDDRKAGAGSVDPDDFNAIVDAVKTLQDNPGGSLPIEVVRFPIAFDTPDLLTGVVVYTPTPGDLILISGFVVTTEWDGDTPSGGILSQGGDVDSESLGGTYNMLFAADPTGIGTHIGYVGQTATAAYLALDATPIVAAVDDGEGGDPGATQGEAEVLLVIAKAA